MQIIRSRTGVPIRLTDERWKHVSKNHPEVAPMRQEILETIAEPSLELKVCRMEALKILEKSQSLDWDYDEEADVLYLSVGEPEKALGVDIGEGLVVRMHATEKEVVGLTVVGLRSRLLKNLAESRRAP